MTTIILVIHLMIAAALVGVILLQKSEGGALGMGGGGMSGFMTGRSTANLLTRTTAILAAAFFLTSLTLAYLAGNRHPATDSLLVPTQPGQSQPIAPKPAPAPKAPTAPAPPAQPTAPLAK
jgi:preprotein translocase subunit SecG